jgi:hypothetical protein
MNLYIYFKGRQLDARATLDSLKIECTIEREIECGKNKDLRWYTVMIVSDEYTKFVEDLYFSSPQDGTTKDGEMTFYETENRRISKKSFIFISDVDNGINDNNDNQYREMDKQSNDQRSFNF